MKKNLVKLAWGLGIGVTCIAALTWYQHVSGPLSQLSVYQIFPLFGLIAFSLMWTHYMIAAARTHYGVPKEKFAVYNQTTFLIVFFALLLHPGLLIWQLWRDKFGLPVDYVAPDMRLYVILGQIALIAFLFFELHRFYSERAWWHWVERASDVAMILILIHAYNLGTSLVEGWFKLVWIFYGLTFAAVIAYGTYKRHQATGKWL